MKALRRCAELPAALDVHRPLRSRAAIRVRGVGSASQEDRASLGLTLRSRPRPLALEGSSRPAACADGLTPARPNLKARVGRTPCVHLSRSRSPYRRHREPLLARIAHRRLSSSELLRRTARVRVVPMFGCCFGHDRSLLSSSRPPSSLRRPWRRRSGLLPPEPDDRNADRRVPDLLPPADAPLPPAAVGGLRLRGRQRRHRVRCASARLADPRVARRRTRAFDRRVPRLCIGAGIVVDGAFVAACVRGRRVQAVRRGIAGAPTRIIIKVSRNHNRPRGAEGSGENMARRTLTGSLYKAARVSATGRAVRTGRAGRRAKNIAVGRALGKAGFWSRLWR